MTKQSTEFAAGRTYFTRDGKIARILCTNREGNDHPIVGLVYFPELNREELHSWNLDGTLLATGYESPYDLMPEDSWKELPIDQPVLFQTMSDETWHKGHFAGVHNNHLPLVFIGGRSRWTSDGNALIVKRVVKASGQKAT